MPARRTRSPWARCIGASFAQVEMKVVLRQVLRRVRLRIPSRRPERPRTRHVTVVPSRGARVVVEQRLAAPARIESAAVADSVTVA
jgi:cytochrome P450 family 135